MNKLTIIGNLTNDPDLRTTTSGINVCSFSVAVNRRHRGERQPETDFFKVTAWRQLAENCAKYLAKGKKVCVVGPVEVETWEQHGKHGANLKVTAEDVEFLSGKQGPGEQTAEPVKDPETGYTAVETDELPF